MKTFLFIFLAGYAVRCHDNNYYVIQMPEDPKTFKVYWNVPTMQCKSKKIPFTGLLEKYGILQNDDDSFRGEKVSILYDPGLFPALLKNETSGELKYRNGGVPQEGDLVKHLEVFTKELEQSIPDKDFDGVGIIDFESWRPVFRQNFGVLTPYKDYSYEIEKRVHWWWKKSWIQAEAKRRFEESGRAFMQTTLSRAKQLRPRARWGYYGFPYCFNMAANNVKESCADNVPEENDSTHWLWSESTALYPSVYSSEALSSSQLSSLIRGRVKEAARLRKKAAPILPYFWFRYREGPYFREEDLNKALSTLYKSEANGLIIWGSSNDVNTNEKCHKLLNYINEVLGPAIAKYTKPDIKLQEEYDTTNDSTTINPVMNVTMDPEFVWVPPKNYSENIKHMVDEELKEEQEIPKTKTNDSLLIDLILHSIATYCFDCKGYENGTNDVDNNRTAIYDNLNEKDNSRTVIYDSTSETDNKTAIEMVTEKQVDTESKIALVTEDPFKMNKTEFKEDAGKTEEYSGRRTEIWADDEMDSTILNDPTQGPVTVKPKRDFEESEHYTTETSISDTIILTKDEVQSSQTTVTKPTPIEDTINIALDSTTEHAENNMESDITVENFEDFTVRNTEDTTANLFDLKWIEIVYGPSISRDNPARNVVAELSGADMDVATELNNAAINVLKSLNNADTNSVTDDITDADSVTKPSKLNNEDTNIVTELKNAGIHVSTALHNTDSKLVTEVNADTDLVTEPSELNLETNVVYKLNNAAINELNALNNEDSKLATEVNADIDLVTEASEIVNTVMSGVTEINYVNANEVTKLHNAENNEVIELNNDADLVNEPSELNNLVKNAMNELNNAKEVTKLHNAGTNEVIENESSDVNDLNAGSTIDLLNSTSVAPSLPKQVAGSAPRAGPRFFVCTLYFYSIAKCLCVIFDICTML